MFLDFFRHTQTGLDPIRTRTDWIPQPHAKGLAHQSALSYDLVRASSDANTEHVTKHLRTGSSGASVAAAISARGERDRRTQRPVCHFLSTALLVFFASLPFTSCPLPLLGVHFPFPVHFRHFFSLQLCTSLCRRVLRVLRYPDRFQRGVAHKQRETAQQGSKSSISLI